MSSSDLPSVPDPGGTSGPTGSDPSPDPDAIVAVPEVTAPPVAAENAGPPTRLGASTFTIEGRSAPALFVIGWLATLVGFGMVAIALLSGDTTAGRVLLIVGLLVLAIGLIAAAGSQGMERRVRAVLPYVGPSPFLVFAAVLPVSILAGVLVALPLHALGVPLDGPFGALVAVSVQAVVYVSLVRLLVVDTGALSWREMGVLSLDRTAFGEIAGGALWAIPIIGVTVVVTGILLAIFPVQPVSPLPPTVEPGRLRAVVAGRGHRRAVRRGDPVPGVRDDGLGPRPWRPAGRHPGRAHLRLRARPDGLRRRRSARRSAWRRSGSGRVSRSRSRSACCSCAAGRCGRRSGSTPHSTASCSSSPRSPAGRSEHRAAGPRRAAGPDRAG